MARERLLECAFLIPTRRDRSLSDGKLHRPATWKWLRAQLHQFGGATWAGDLSEGWYLDSETGKPVTDRSRRYTVAVPRRMLGQLRAVLRAAGREFAQKCTYLSVAGYVEFVENPDYETR
jgi:hypothetical protein